MSLRLLIDEDTQDRRLVQILRHADHDILTVNEAGLMGQLDPQTFNYAIENNRLLLTLNCADFEFLHLSIREHTGILAIYRDANSSKNMSFKAIVKAIANVESAGITLTNQFIRLNQWNY